MIESSPSISYSTQAIHGELWYSHHGRLVDFVIRRYRSQLSFVLPAGQRLGLWGADSGNGQFRIGIAILHFTYIYFTYFFSL